MSDYFLEVNHLKKYFILNNDVISRISGKSRTLKAVDDISFFVKQGETLGLVGESGCVNALVFGVQQPERLQCRPRSHHHSRHCQRWVKCAVVTNAASAKMRKVHGQRAPLKILKVQALFPTEQRCPR